MGTINAGVLEGRGSISAALSSSKPFVLKPENDKVFDCELYDGELIGYASIEGVLYNSAIDSTDLTGYASLSGTFVPGFLFDVSSDVLEATGYISGEVYISSPPLNWVAWSKIGDARVLIDQTNEAGMMPVGFSGQLLRALSLGDNCVLYGTNGIAYLIPVNNPIVSYGQQTISNIGIIDETAVTGNDERHFFIGTDYSLYVIEVGNKPKKLYYSEYIQQILPAGKRVVSMSYDSVEDILYISTALGGLVYSGKGLGGGYGSLTSLVRAGTDLLCGSDSAISTPYLETETDIIDLEIRGLKTIRWVDIQGILPPNLEVRLGYRYDNNSAFSYTPWGVINTEGSVFFGITALEFKLGIRLPTSGTVFIDNVMFKFTVSDKRLLRSATRYDRRYNV